MDYQGSVYYYDGYSNFMKGKSQFQGENLEADSGARRDWFVGYRHAMADHHCRVKRELDNVAHQFDSSSQQFESLATKQDEGWNGEGLPPVGCICEGNFPRFGSLVWKWQDCLVLWRFENECAVRCIHTGTLHYCDDFRPTLTDEERKREEAVAAFKELKPQLVGQLAGILYDQIAAGKIPHIKLESTHE